MGDSSETAYNTFDNSLSPKTISMRRQADSPDTATRFFPDIFLQRGSAHPLLTARPDQTRSTCAIIQFGNAVAVLSELPGKSASGFITPEQLRAMTLKGVDTTLLVVTPVQLTAVAGMGVSVGFGVTAEQFTPLPGKGVGLDR